MTLAMGILTQAIRDLIRPQTRRERDVEEWKNDAHAWLNSTDQDFGTFLWVCSVIRANPSAVRDWVLSLESLPEDEKKSTIQMLLRLTYNGNGQEKNNPFDGPESGRKDGNLKRTA